VVFRELRKGNAQKKGETVSRSYDRQNPPHHEPGLQARQDAIPPRQQEGNPMNWVSQRTTSRLPGDSHDAETGVRVLSILRARRTLT